MQEVYKDMQELCKSLTMLSYTEFEKSMNKYKEQIKKCRILAINTPIQNKTLPDNLKLGNNLKRYIRNNTDKNNPLNSKLNFLFESRDNIEVVNNYIFLTNQTLTVFNECLECLKVNKQIKLIYIIDYSAYDIVFDTQIQSIIRGQESIIKTLKIGTFKFVWDCAKEIQSKEDLSHFRVKKMDIL